MKILSRTLSSLLLLLAVPAQAVVTTYCCDQTAEDAYLAALAVLNPAVNIIHESFEDGPWIPTRSPAAQSSVSNLGITWTQFDDALRTNTADSVDGSYQMYTYDFDFGHSQPDGYTLTADSLALYGVGGWFKGTGTKLSFIVDSDAARVDFTGEDGTVAGTWKFLGFIDTVPFTALEIVRTDEMGNETEIFWSDDFNIATQVGPGNLQFDPAGYSVAENGASVTLTVTRTGGSAGAISVDYASSDGTATASSDYTATSGTLSFADGVLSQTFSVAILNDSTYEGDENFNLTLSNATGGASVGTPSSSVVTITEDDPAPPAGSLQFDNTSYTVTENGVSVQATVTRTGGSFGSVSVNYAASDGSATAGNDYAATSGTLTFADSVMSQSFSVSIINDTTYEGDEDFALTLSGVTGGASLGTPATATITINEDDPVPPAGSLQFNSSSYPVLENGGSVLITVTRSGGSFGSVGVDYASVDGSATAGSDYTTATGTLTFADGVLSQTFSVPILDDSTYEGDEDLQLNLSNVTGGASLGMPASTTITINENDPPPSSGVLQFSGSAYSVAENGASILITVTRSGGSFGTVGVDYSSVDGSATATSDYTAMSGTLTFADSVLSQTFSVPIIDDSTYEGDEDFQLNLSTVTGGASLGTPSSATVTINEDDPTPPAGSLQFSGSTFTIAEDGLSLQLTVTRTGGSFGSVGVDYASANGTATAGSDYTATSGTLTFADGIVSQAFSITITDDMTYEGDEDFQLNLSNVSGGASLGTPASATVTISENDPTPPAGSLQFSGSTYPVAENGASVLITVTRSGGSFGSVGVDYASVDGSATAGSDYTAAMGTLTFADGVMSQAFSVTILDDMTYEGDETVQLNLTNATGGASIGAPASATVTINEDDPTPPAGSLQLSGSSYSVAENGASVLVTVTRSGGSFGSVDVDYATADGSAMAGSDYTTTSSTLSLADGVTSQSFSVPITDDMIYEGDENFSVNLSNVSGGATLGTPSSATVTITENDPMPPAGDLQFGASSYTVAENGSSVLITVTRTGGSFGTVGVDYASTNSTATAGSDYTVASGTLTFADGVTSQSFSVSILDDMTYEGDEAFWLSLSNISGGASLGSPSSATVTITEDDPTPPAGDLQFSAGSYNVAENGASILITVTRTGGSFGSVGVDYASVDASATAGSDYTTATGTLTFADGVMSQSFSVPILDDMTYEGDETFQLNLSNVGGGASLGMPASTTVTITEDDPAPPSGSLQFSSSGYMVAENGASVQLTVTRSGGSFGLVSVDYSTADLSATASNDYTATSGTLSFADGVMSQTFNVTILEDMIFEGDEAFQINLSNVGGGASLGMPASATVTIIDNDPAPPAGSLQFSSDAYTVAENGASVQLTVTRIGGSFGSVSVDYATVDGSGTATSDYTATSGMLTFAHGVTSQTFNVTILDDMTYEGDENFSVNLSNVGGGASLGMPASTTVTITEDDPTPAAGSLQLSASNYNVPENGTSVLITVTRTGGSFGTVGVDYASVDGSAMATSDYTASNGTLSFADGVVSQTFSVPIVDDMTYEGNETFSVNLSNITGGAVPGTPVSATVTIIEDDPVPPSGSLQFSGTGYTVVENAGTVLLTVTRSGGSFGSVNVDYATTDGNATAGSDYTTTTGTLTFADGVVSQTFSVPILDDITFEGDETFAAGLSNATGGAMIGSPFAAAIVITEDDPAPPSGSLQFSASTYTGAENGGNILFTVTRSGGSFGSVSVDYATVDDSATAGSDYTATSGTLTFGDGVLSQTFSVTVLDDSNFEGDEAFDVDLSNITGGAMLGTPASATVTITEDDPAPPAGSLQFSGGTYTVAENGASLMVTVTRTGGSFGWVSVDYATSDGTATATADYQATSGSLTFADGEMSQTFNVVIVDDTTFEGDEDFNLTLSTVTGGATLGSPSSAVVTITEDDAPPSAGSLQLSGSTYSVAEDGAAIEITVNRVGGSFGPVVVDYSTNNISATAGDDYTSVSGKLPFKNGEVSNSFFIPIIDDMNWEGDETFMVRLANPFGGAVIGVPSSAMVTIIEDDAPPSAGSLQFSGSSYSGDENGGLLQVVVTRTGGSSGSVGVDYATTNGSAMAGSDYTTTSGTLTFADGEMSQAFDIPILDDSVFEGDESFSIALSNATGGAAIGLPATADVTIVEDDTPPAAGSLQFSGSASSIAENGGVVRLTVTRSGGSFGSVSVEYETAELSATAGSDYTTASGTLTLLQGELSQSFEVTILDDPQFEGDETFTVSLLNAAGGATIGTPSSVTVTIIENDVRPNPPPRKGGGGAGGPLFLLLLLGGLILSRMKSERNTQSIPVFSLALLLAFGMMAPSPATAEMDHGNQQMASADNQDTADPHAKHRKMMKSKKHLRSIGSYDLENLDALDMNGLQTTLNDAIDADKPVILNFIFTTCTTICPVMSATFSQVQRKLGTEVENVLMISISIDPEHDTPARLREYATQFRAGEQWQFLTGSLDDMIAVQKAFDAYFGSKMNHRPLYFLRAAGGGDWIRLEGMISASTIIEEYRQLRNST